MAQVFRRKNLPVVILYLLFLMSGGYALAGIIELVLRMGHGSGMYADYGKTAIEATFAVALMIVYITWLLIGTVTAGLVFRGQWKLRWFGALTAISLLVMLPAAVVYLLGVGHS